MSTQRDPSPRATPRIKRHAPHRAGRAGNRWLLSVAANGVVVVLALGVLGGVASCASSTTTSTTGVGAGSDATLTTTAPASGDEWIPLRSQASADILAAARRGQLFQNAQANGGDGPDLSRLGIPALVQALRPTGVTADQLPDFYVVPALNAAGDASDAIELVLNPARTAVQEIAIVTYTTPRAGGAISALTQDQAAQLVASQRQVSASALGHPSLVYFALDPQWQANDNNQSGWTGGGALPADPIWLVPAANGEQYFAGEDGAVYTVDQLPQVTP